MARSADESTILQMFRYMRPMGSVTEQAFIDTYLGPLGFKRDAYDNLVLVQGDAPFLFSAHVDTVHRNEGMQSLSYNEETGILRLSKRAKRNGSNCLGADDTAGIWLITELVKAGVQGTFIIHHGEESGCIGSTDLAKGDPMWLSQFRFALAFDRAYEDDVITHQMGRRTASEAFAKSLAKALGGGYKPSSYGAYTDTNEYAHIIPECTNISVGYNGQHGSGETQDVRFLIGLRDRLVATDFTSLVIERDPTANDWDDDDDFGFYNSRFWRGSSSYSSKGRSLTDLVKAYPETVADILEAYGITREDVMDEIARYDGMAA